MKLYTFRMALVGRCFFAKIGWVTHGDIILTYLTENLMAELGEKLQAESKDGTVVICNTFGIKGWTPERTDRGQNLILNLNVYTYLIDRRRMALSGAASA